MSRDPSASRRRPASALTTALALAVLAASAATGARAATPEGAGPADLPAPIVNGVAEHGEPAVGFFFAGGGYCSATLIGCSTVLTAAHCLCGDALPGDDCQARLDLQPAGGRYVYFQHAGFFPVAGVAVHPGYDYPRGHDIAVLRLAAPVEGVRPARINRVRRPAHGTPGRIVGFGRSRGDTVDFGLKRSGRVTTAPCREVDDATHVCWDFVEPIGAPGEDSSTCHGDSGGPLFVDLGDGPVIAGVTSGGDALCLEPTTPWDADVFVDHEWIEAAAGADLGTGTSGGCGDLPVAGEPGGAVLGASGSYSAAAPAVGLTLEVPPGVRRLVVGVNGTWTEGEVDLLLRRGGVPTRAAHDCRSTRSRSLEACVVEQPSPGTWHLLAERSHGRGELQVTATLYGGDPPPPPGAWLASPALPGFSAKVRFDGAVPGAPEERCIAETLCVSGALAGRPEAFLKVIGPRRNGFLWAQVSRFTPARVEVWLRRDATGELRYYDLPAVGAGSADLPGLQDREAFRP